MENSKKAFVFPSCCGVYYPVFLLVFLPIFGRTITTNVLAHPNRTLFFTLRAAFVCKKKTRSFRVFPPEN